MNKEARRLRDWPWSHGGKVEGQPRASAARGSHPDSTQRKAGPALSETLPQGLTWSSGREGWQLALGPVSPTAVLSRSRLSSPAGRLRFSLPKPALPSRDPPLRTASWEVQCRAGPLGQLLSQQTAPAR